MFLKNKENIENKFWLAVCLLTILVIVISAISLPFTDDTLSFIKDVSGTAATILTAYTAVILFQDWRDIKKTEILSQHSTEVFPILNDLASSLFFLKNSLVCTIDQFYKLKEYERENGKSEIRENKGISSFSSILSKAVPDNIFNESCSKNIYSLTCKNAVMNSMTDFEKIIEKELKKSCGKSKESEACKNYKESIKDLFRKAYRFLEK